MITAEIMKALPSISILVSATLAYPEEIPYTIQNFKTHHSIENDDFIAATVVVGYQNFFYRFQETRQIISQQVPKNIFFPFE